MADFFDNVSKELGIEIPEELRTFYKLLELNKTGKRWVLDFSHLGNNWLEQIPYHILLPSDTPKTPVVGEYIGFYCDNAADPSAPPLLSMNVRSNSLSGYPIVHPTKITEHFMFGTSFSPMLVDRGAYLTCFYSFRRFIGFGVYESGQYVVPTIRFQSLSDLIKLDEDSFIKALEDSAEDNPMVMIPLRKEAHSRTIADILPESRYVISDGEIGFLTTFDEVKRQIDDYIIPLSGGVLRYDALEHEAINDTRYIIRWVVDGRYLETTHRQDGDYLDLSIYPWINNVLGLLLNSNLRYLAFNYPGFGGTDYHLCCGTVEELRAIQFMKGYSHITDRSGGRYADGYFERY